MCVYKYIYKSMYINIYIYLCVCVCACVKNGKTALFIEKKRRKTQIELHKQWNTTNETAEWNLNRGMQIGKPQWADMVSICMMKSCRRMNDTSNTDIDYIQCISY